MGPFSTYLFIVVLLCVAGFLLAPTVRRPDALAAELEGGEHRETFGTREVKAPNWGILGARSARVDIYDDALIITSFRPLCVGMRRSEVRGIEREGDTRTRLLRAHDRLQLVTTPEQHAQLVGWLEGD